MDNLYLKKELDYRDLRVISGALETFQNSNTFDEKIDLMLSRND